MNRIVKVSLLELKKIFIRPGVYIGILIACLASIAMAYEAIHYPNAFQIRHVYSFFGSIAEIVIFLYAGKSLGDEFKYGTSTPMFSNSISRSHILLSKVISLCLFGILLGIISNIIPIIAKSFIVRDLVLSIELLSIGKVTLIYFVYSFCIGSFALLISVCTLSSIAALIGCIGGFWIISSVVKMIVLRYESFSTIARMIPFSTASNAIQFHVFAGYEAIGLVFGGGIFFILASLILHKRDLK